MYLKHVSDNGGQPDPNRENREIGEAITMIRAQAIEENVLAIRTVTASKRIVAETLKRLSVFTSEELAYLSGADAPTSDRETLMWIAMCRYYAIVGEFAFDVLKAHYLTGRISLISRTTLDSWRTGPPGIRKSTSSANSPRRSCAGTCSRR